MKKWMIPLIGLTIALALGAVGAVTAFALTSDGGSDNPQVPHGGDTAGEVLHGDPTYEEWLSRHKLTQDPVTSIDEIDPNVCNLVHNINVCTPEELEEVFGAFTDIASVETHGRTQPVVGQVVASSIDEGDLEPFFVDSEPRYTVQSLKEAVEQDCDLAGGTVYVTSGGELGCVVAHNLEDSGEEMVSSSQPPTIEPLPAPVTQ